jgi:2,4-dichlorophenol 6-monooxygenase
MSRQDADIEETPVLIVGGGAAGLSSSIMLARLGIGSLLVERHPGTSLIPKAHIIHCRTLEILGQLGLEEELREAACPPENFTHTSWYTNLGSEEVWDGKIIASIPSWSGGPLAEHYAEITASPMANLPQHLLEPRLRAHAEALNGTDRVRFNHELTALEQDDAGVLATILDRESGETFQVRADYLIAADGGKTVGKMLGIEMVGPEPIVDAVSLAFDADFSEYLQEDYSLIRLFLSPNPDGTVRRFSLVASGPEPWDRNCVGWRSTAVLPVGSELKPDAFTPEQAIEQLRTLLKVPDLEVRNMTMGHWLIESVVAERFVDGRTFLIGDAAHRHSPMGGLGLNTGIQDAHNLAWKLAAVLDVKASPALLETYETERRPVAQRRVDFATFSFYNHLSVSGGFGMLPGASEEHNRGVLERLFSDSADGETRRAQLEEMIGTLRREFQHADLDLGYEYADSAAVVPDGSEAPPRDPVGYEYVPVARPGHRLPHAWLERDGEAVHTHQLQLPGRFLLLAGDAGAAWVEAAEGIAAETGVAIDAYVVGPDAALQDPDGRWAELRGHDPRGAVLVRPDGHVAFRSPAASAAAEAELRGALDVVLGRGAPVAS